MPEHEAPIVMSGRARAGIWIAVCGLVVVLAVPAVVVIANASKAIGLFSPAGESPAGDVAPRIEEQLDLPTSFIPYQSEPYPDMLVELYEDGTAAVTSAPLGEVGFVDESTCLTAAAELTSGHGTWGYYKPGWIVVEVAGRQIPLGSSSEFLGDLDWTQVGFHNCATGEETWMSLGSY